MRLLLLLLKLVLVHGHIKDWPPRINPPEIEFGKRKGY